MFKFYFDVKTGSFRPCQFKIDRLTYNEIHQKYGKGLNEKDANDHEMFFGKNMTDIPKKSCLQLLFQEVLSPFYIFQVGIY